MEIIELKVGLRKYRLSKRKPYIFRIPNHSVMEHITVEKPSKVRVVSYNIPYLNYGEKVYSAHLRRKYKMSLVESTLKHLTKYYSKYDFFLINPAGFDLYGVEKIINNLNLGLIIFLDSKAYYSFFEDEELSLLEASELRRKEGGLFKIDK